MRGRVWFLAGAAAGVALGLGHVPYLAGAAASLAESAQRAVGSAGSAIVRAGARHGAPRRAVQGVFGLLTVLVPGVTALLLVLAGAAASRLRVVIGLLVVAVGVVGFRYLPHGVASGTLVFALGAAALAVFAVGPVFVMPLAAVAALIGTEFLPRLIAGGPSAAHGAVVEVHRALFARPGAPLALEAALLALAAVPFALAARLALR
ncbi:MAG TPA: hypothetical protein VFN50_04590 [Acidimicrobiales bacterium]|nr:hypothetical protein [Acidimicrobiales bacterium]